MKKVFLVKDYDKVWAVQTRVEALQDWAASGSEIPCEVDITGTSALIIIDDKKKASYESEYKWERDMGTLDSLIKDIKDPLFRDDGHIIKEFDFDKPTTAENSMESFEEYAKYSCSPLGWDLLRPLGFTHLPASEKEDDASMESNVGNRSVAELEEMAKSIDLTAGLENLTPDKPIEEFHHDELDEAETSPIETPMTEHTDEAQPIEPVVTPAEAIIEASNIEPTEDKIVDPKDDFIKELMDACAEYEITPRALVAMIMAIKSIANKAAEVDMISTESISADDYKSLRTSQYPKNMMKRKITTTKQAKRYYKELERLNPGIAMDLDENNKKLIAKEKGIYIGDKYGFAVFLLPDGRVGFLEQETDDGVFAKVSTIEQDIHESQISTDDVTGSEDYSYQNAVPYVQDPHATKEEDLDIPRQGMNVAGGMNNVDAGDVINYIEKVTTGTESIDPTNTPIEAEDVYSSLVNDGPAGFGLESVEELEYVETSMEAFFSKHKNKNNNEVLRDINKVLNDAKEIAKKAWQELQDRNQELIAKYGAFIKMILDIKDIIFMDSRSISLQVASFNTKKANSEIVPDSAEEALLKQVSSGAVGAVFGPFANMAKSEEKPGQLMLAVANELRTELVKGLQKEPIKPSIELKEDELNGVYTLVVEFKNVPQEVAKESIEEPIEDNKPLIERLAMESQSDDEFFSKVLDHKNDIEYSLAMECVNNNMWTYFKTGEKLLNDRAVSGKRILEYIKK